MATKKYISGKQAAAHFIEAAKDQNSPEWQYLIHTIESVEKQENTNTYAGELSYKLDVVRDNAERYNKAKDDAERNVCFEACAFAMQQVFNDAGQAFDDEDVQALSGVSEEIQERVDQKNMGWGVLRDRGEVKTASAWIEQFQKEVKPNRDPDRELVAQIIAARQLSDAVRGDRRNIDNTELSLDQIKEASAKLARSNEFHAFMENSLPTAALVKDGHGGRLQEAYNRTVESPELAASSASVWIERFQKEARKGEAVKADTVAKIIAARQLADAVRGKRGNIDQKQLTLDEVLERAELLKKSPAFKEFMEKNPPDAKLVKDGHGGRMEMSFDAYVKTREDCQDLSEELFGRYQFQYNCKTYAEFIQKEAWAEEQIGRAGKDALEQQAARMATAAVLGRQDPPPAFNEQNLKAKAVCLASSPAFRMAMREPDVVRKAVTGQPLAVLEKIGEVERDCKDLEESGRSNQDTLTALRNKLGGHKALTPAEREALDRDPRIVAAKERKAALKEKYSDVLDMDEDDLLLSRIARSEAERQEAFSSSSKSKDIQNSLKAQQRMSQEIWVKERVKWEKQWDRKCELIRQNEELSDEQKLSEMQKVMETREAQLRRGRELCERQNQYDREEAQAIADLKKAQREVYGVKPKNVDTIIAEEKKYLAGRSPAYNKMFKAVDTYVDAVGTQKYTLQHGVDAVCSILEYQDGKEAKGGSQRERVDLSMRTLAQITAGTDAEYILDRQIAKINEARGLQPGQKGALSKEELVEQRAEDNSLYDRIKNLGFGRQSDAEVEEQIEEVEQEMDPKAQKRAELDKLIEGLDVHVVQYGNKQEPIEQKKKSKERVIQQEPEEGMYISEFI